MVVLVFCHSAMIQIYGIWTTWFFLSMHLKNWNFYWVTVVFDIFLLRGNLFSCWESEPWHKKKFWCLVEIWCNFTSFGICNNLNKFVSKIWGRIKYNKWTLMGFYLLQWKCEIKLVYSVWSTAYTKTFKCSYSILWKVVIMHTLLRGTRP